MFRLSVRSAALTSVAAIAILSIDHAGVQARDDAMDPGVRFVRQWPKVSESIVRTKTVLKAEAQKVPVSIYSKGEVDQALEAIAGMAFVIDPADESVDRLTAQVRLLMFRKPNVTHVPVPNGVLYKGLPSYIAHSEVRVATWSTQHAHQVVRTKEPNGTTFEQSIAVTPEFCAIHTPAVRGVEVIAANKIGTPFASSELLTPLSMGVGSADFLRAHTVAGATVRHAASRSVVVASTRGLPRRWGYEDESGKRLSAGDADHGVSGAAAYGYWESLKGVFPVLILHVKAFGSGQLYVQLVRVVAVQPAPAREPMEVPADTYIVDYTVLPAKRYSVKDVWDNPPWSDLVRFSLTTSSAQPEPAAKGGSRSASERAAEPTPATRTSATESATRAWAFWAGVAALIVVFIALVGRRLRDRPRDE